MSEFKPLRSITVSAFKAVLHADKLDMFRSKDGASLYLAKEGEPQLPVCFVSTKIGSFADVKAGAMISTFLDDKGAEYNVLHNAGKKAEGSL